MKRRSAPNARKKSHSYASITTLLVEMASIKMDTDCADLSAQTVLKRPARQNTKKQELLLGSLARSAREQIES
jgi:hypothetical protein